MSQDLHEKGRSQLEGAGERLHAENKWGPEALRLVPGFGIRHRGTGGQTVEPGKSYSHPCLDRKGPPSSQHLSRLLSPPLSSCFPEASCPDQRLMGKTFAFTSEKVHPEGELRGDLGELSGQPANPKTNHTTEPSIIDSINRQVSCS